MIAIGSDHGGVELKEKVIKHLQARGIECEDTGCYSTESCDYPVFGHAAAQACKCIMYGCKSNRGRTCLQNRRHFY